MKKLATAILGVVGVGLFAFGLVVKVLENTAISIFGIHVTKMKHYI